MKYQVAPVIHGVVSVEFAVECNSVSPYEAVRKVHEGGRNWGSREWAVLQDGDWWVYTAETVITVSGVKLGRLK